MYTLLCTHPHLHIIHHGTYINDDTCKKIWRRESQLSRLCCSVSSCASKALANDLFALCNSSICTCACQNTTTLSAMCTLFVESCSYARTPLCVISAVQLLIISPKVTIKALIIITETQCDGSAVHKQQRIL